jgi:hypothetical protein
MIRELMAFWEDGLGGNADFFLELDGNGYTTYVWYREFSMG